MVPAFPMANLVVGQARFTFGALQTFFNAMFGFGHSGELRFLGLWARIRQGVVRLDDVLVVPVFVADHDQDFLMTLLSLVGPRDHAAFDDFDDQRAFRTVAHVDLGPIVIATRGNPFVDTHPEAFRLATAPISRD